jgi:MFS family permease
VNLWKSLKGLPRDVWILSVATLINRAGMMVLPFLVLYLTRELGFSAARAGATLSVYGFGSLVSAPLSGRLTDRIGPLPVMRASLALTAVLLFIYPYVESFPLLVAVTFIWAVAADSFRPASMVLIADVVEPERLKSAYALYRLAINVGMSIGPAAAGFIAANAIGWIFIADAVTSLAAAIVLVVTAFNVVHTPSKEEYSSSPFKLLVLDDRRMTLFLGASMLFGIMFYQIDGPLPLFLVQDLHQSPAFYGLLFSLNTVLIVLMEVPLNAATSHWAHWRALALGAFLTALGSGMFGFASGAPFVIVAMVVWTFGEMMFFPQAAAFVAEIAPQHRRGQYMGAYALAFGLGFVIAPWAGTASYARFGGKALWIGVFFVGLVSTLILTRVTVQRRILSIPVSPTSENT